MRRFLPFLAALAACTTQPTAPGVPSALHLVSGDGQTGVPGYRLANQLMVKMVDTDGNPDVGDSVTFTVSDPTIVLEGASTVTDGAGMARAWWRLGATLGTQSVTAHASSTRQLAPVTVTATAHSNLMQSIDGGAWGLCGIDMQGHLGCWRPPFKGLPDTQTTFVPVTASVQFTQVTVPVDLTSSNTTVPSGHPEGCALATTGRPWCFTLDIAAHVIGLTELAGAYPAFTQIVSADELASYCGLTALGEAWCWGANTNGQLGDGTHAAHATPMPVSTNARFVQMDMDNQACAVTSDGQAWCWGKNNVGQAGVAGSSADVLTPTPVNTALRFTKVRIDAYQGVSCGLVTGTGMYCWGRTDFMGSAYAPSTTAVPLAINTASFATPVEMAATGGLHVLLNSNGSFAWSGDFYFCCGGEGLGPHLSPAPLTNLIRDIQIIHGYDYFCGTAVLGGATLCPSAMMLVTVSFPTAGLRDVSAAEFQYTPGTPPVVGVPFP